MRVYSDDGRRRPFRVEAPGGPGTLGIRNTGPLEFPMTANVGSFGRRGIAQPAQSTIIQGGATWSYRVRPEFDSVQIVLRTEGRNLHGKIEVLQGPNSVRQEIELDEDDGYNRPFVGTIETPGWGSVIRIVNTADMTFPMTASVAPVSIGQGERGYCDAMGPGGWDGRMGGPGMGPSWHPGEPGMDPYVPGFGGPGMGGYTGGGPGMGGRPYAPGGYMGGGPYAPGDYMGGGPYDRPYDRRTFDPYAPY